MSGEQSVHSGDASQFRKILEQTSPDSTYSPRTELLSDADGRDAHRSKNHRTPSHKRQHSHSRKDRERGAAADLLSLKPRHISRLLVREELEAIDMRKVLIQTSQRLDQEARRASEADTRAREAEARVIALQTARKAAQAETLREREMLKAYQAQVEVARNEILRAQRELDNLAAEKARAEDEASRERSKARALAKEIEIQRALEQGREEGKIQGFIDGRNEGWRLGTQQGMKEAFKQVGQAGYYDDDLSEGSEGSDSITPSLATHSQQPRFDNRLGSRPTASLDNRPGSRPTPSLDNRPGSRPIPSPVRPTPDTLPERDPGARPNQTATPTTRHRRSGSLAQSFKSRIRVNSDPKPPSNVQESSSGRRLVTNPERTSNASRPASLRLTRSPSRESIPPAPVQRPVTPQPTARLTPSPSRDQISPIPINNRPSTPRHSPSSPLPGGYIPLQENGRVSLPPPHELEPPPPSPHTPATPLLPELAPLQDGHVQNVTVNIAPTITVQEPTPPGPLLGMPDPQPAAASATVVTENNIKPSKVLAREQVLSSRTESPPLPPLPTERPNKGKQRQRKGPPRTGPGLHAPGRSSPSDTSTEFSQFDIVEQPERVRGFGAGSGSQLSVIMEGGSSVAESPELERNPTPRMANQSSTRASMTQAALFAGQGILNDPREYEEFSETPLTPTQVAHRRMVAEQLRHSPSEGDRRNPGRSTRDDVSIKSSTTRTSAPRRRPQLRMPERLGASKDVEVLEKQAEMYDAFGTDRAFPTFDSQSSPDDLVPPTRTPEPSRGHRRGSSSTTVPEIVIQPPSRSTSKSSRHNHFTPDQRASPIPASTAQSRRYSLQGSPVSPSRVPLPMSTAQPPISLETQRPGEFALPPGFVPTQGAQLPTTPSNIPLPLSTAQVPVSLENSQSAESGFPPGFVPSQWPSSPSRVPLPHSTGQIPIGLGTSSTANVGLPAGFMPMPGPPEGFVSFPSAAPPHNSGKTPAELPSKTLRMSMGELPSQGAAPNFAGITPSGIALPLSPMTPTMRLADDVSSARRVSVGTMHYDLPRVATTNEPATLPQNRYSISPARMPLPESMMGSPHDPAGQSPWPAWGGSIPGGGAATPGAARPASLNRPASRHGSEAGVREKGSAASLASLYKKFDPDTYVDPAYFASGSATGPPYPMPGDGPAVSTRSRPGSVRSMRGAIFD